jgi:hypothetical protein
MLVFILYFFIFFFLVFRGIYAFWGRPLLRALFFVISLIFMTSFYSFILVNLWYIYFFALLLLRGVLVLLVYCSSIRYSNYKKVSFFNFYIFFFICSISSFPFFISLPFSFSLDFLIDSSFFASFFFIIFRLVFFLVFVSYTLLSKGPFRKG